MRPEEQRRSEDWHKAMAMTPDEFLATNQEKRADWVSVIGVDGFDSWIRQHASSLDDDHQRELLNALADAALRLSIDRPPPDWR